MRLYSRKRSAATHTCSFKIKTKRKWQIAAQLADEKSVPCTACHYCTDHCLQQIKISDVMEDFVKVLRG